MPANPWSESLTLTTAGVAYNLFALIQALDTTVRYPQCSRLQVQLDSGSGGANLYIGNAGVSSTNKGVGLVAGQAKIWEGIEQNLYDLANVWLTSDTNSVKVNVEYVVH